MKKALIISLALNIAIIGIFAGKRYYYSYGPGAGNNNGIDFNDKWNRMRASVYNDLSIDSTDIVFVGNSLTEGFPVTEIYGKQVKNRGIGGNTIKQLLGRIEDIAKSRPQKIFIEIGINDLRSGTATKEVLLTYSQIVEAIRQRSPRTIIYIQSITPTRGQYANINDSIVTCNNLLFDYCNVARVTFIDLYTHLANNNQLDSAMTGDGIHLNDKGYKAWESVLNGYLHPDSSKLASNLNH